MAKKKTAKKKAAKAPAARKPARAAARKQAKKTAKGPSGKKTARRAAAPARSAPAENPARVTTGRGPGPLEIGNDLVALFNAGQLAEIEQKWWSPAIVSVEGHGMAMAWSGRDKVLEKNTWWVQNNTVHGASAEGPYVGAAGFAVKFRMDVEEKATGRRESMEEVGVYTVQDGKIVREEFMYRTPGA